MKEAHDDNKKQQMQKVSENDAALANGAAKGAKPKTKAVYVAKDEPTKKVAGERPSKQAPQTAGDSTTVTLANLTGKPVQQAKAEKKYRAKEAKPQAEAVAPVESSP